MFCCFLFYVLFNNNKQGGKVIFCLHGGQPLNLAPLSIAECMLIGMGHPVIMIGKARYECPMGTCDLRDDEVLKELTKIDFKCHALWRPFGVR